MKRLLVVTLVAACGGSTAPAPSQPEFDPELHRHGPLPEPAPAPPEPEPDPVALPPTSFGDDLVAPPLASKESMERFDAAERAYARGDYHAAITELTRAFELEEHVEYLFGLAQCYRRIGIAKQALFFYKRYHVMSRGSLNAIDVEQAIADIQAIVDAQGVSSE